MLYRSHRGGVYYTPENTMPAFELAIEKTGFKIDHEREVLLAYKNISKTLAECTSVFPIRTAIGRFSFYYNAFPT